MSWREHPDAPATGTTLCAADDIPDGEALEVVYGTGPGKLRVIALRDGAAVWAYVNRCPHFSLPLNGNSRTFLIPERNRLMCAYHCAVFRFEDGMCVDGPPTGLPLESVPVEVVNGQVLLKATEMTA